MPPEKGTKTGKARGGRKGNRSKGGASTRKKRLSAPILAVWLAAVLVLASLLYFSIQSRRLPELPRESATKNHSTPRREAPAQVPAPEASPGSRATDNLPRHVSPVMNEAGAGHKIEPPGSGPSADMGLIRSPGAPTEGSVRDVLRKSSSASPGRARVSIVIDDFGSNVLIAREFTSLPFPVTLSVLPHQAHSREIAELAHEAGREVILHLPMEPLSKRENPGPGALLLSMPADQIRQNIRAALDTSPYFDGVNNHMGSRMTRDGQAMKTVLSELKGRDLFFIDSMTTSESKGWKTAKELKIPTLKRDIFLDDDPSADAVRFQIARLMKVAKVRGTALAIGHPRETTLRSLQEAAGLFREEGVEMVAAHDLIDRRAEQE